MRVLVTGGAGFIASNIVDKLINIGHEVAVIDNLSTGYVRNLNDRSTFFNTDIVKYNETLEAFLSFRPEICIHHAAQVDVQKSIQDVHIDAEVNIIGTINILKACSRCGVRKVIYPSSAAVYGEPSYLPIDEGHKINPMSFYGISKHTPEHYLMAFNDLYGLKYTILRYANVFGIRQVPKGEGGVISIFISKLLKHESPIIFGDGEQTRDFVYVKDIVDANIAAIGKGDNDIFNISTSITTSVNRLLELLSRIAEVSYSPVYVQSRVGDIKHSYLNNGKAREVLGWYPKYTLYKGLKETYFYYANKS